MQSDVDALDATLRCFPAGLRIAVEPRHESWWTDDLRHCLERNNAALCWADRKGPITPLWRTADWGYLRFHEGKGGAAGGAGEPLPWPFYTDDELEAWTEIVTTTFPDDGEDVYVYFNNDPGGAALVDAITFAGQVADRGRTVTRVPETRPDLAAAEA
jgi:uncharacterized protein YecE (DUF72 family)